MQRRRVSIGAVKPRTHPSAPGTPSAPSTLLPVTLTLSDMSATCRLTWLRRSTSDDMNVESSPTTGEVSVVVVGAVVVVFEAVVVEVAVVGVVGVAVAVVEIAVVSVAVVAVVDVAGAGVAVVEIAVVGVAVVGVVVVELTVET